MGVDCTPCQSAWYPYDFDRGLISFVKATFDPGRKCLSASPVLVYQKLPEISAIFAEDGLMFLSEAKWQVHQFSVAQFPAYLEESPAVASREVANFDVLAGNI